MKDNKSKYYAKISLGIMGGGFLATFPFQDSIAGQVLQGGFEAGLVGGLADWFAVTALFRHPLGLPIPHTALLPKNRNRMLKAIINMLENDWLTKESIQNKIKDMNISAKAVEELEQRLDSSSFHKGVQSLVIHLLNEIDPEKLSPVLEKELKGYLQSVEIEPVLDKMVNEVLKRELDEKALDYVLVETEKWLRKEDTKNKIGTLAKQLLDNTKADGFMKMAIQSFSQMINAEKLGNMLQPFFLKRIVLLQEANNPYRKAVLDKIHSEIKNVKERRELIAELGEWKNTIVEEWNPTDQLSSILVKTKEKFIKLAEDEDWINRHIITILKNQIQALKEDSSRMMKIEGWIQNQLSLMVEKYHAKIGQLVKENLEKLDNETLINIIENNVGKDLQWIRVNGAICGFLIGIVLTSFKMVV
ncbi:hypothetical protein ABE65_012730 [Fictibacillus phosphorivorans]|uniref:DUF445 domain-containing protein n=1 Tax=Fictibacillus phosphorivorans TaxID=1221500 RepID=A0A160IMS7_9BACL|nr:DUF445 domain-containing protein [Fictibacillus phosphorivorans]ANC77613.1 hypothetical protein ABE65_012730 [Fictibacillus phosphorivorans]